MWSAVETDKRRDWRWHAGVYQSGAHRIALNRPEAEDAPEIVERARLPELLRGVKLTVMAGALELKADRLQSEIWPAMIVLTMLFMCAEMALATSKAMLPQKPAGASAPRAASETKARGGGGMSAAVSEPVRRWGTGSCTSGARGAQRRFCVGLVRSESRRRSDCGSAKHGQRCSRSFAALIT